MYLSVTAGCHCSWNCYINVLCGGSNLSGSVYAIGNTLYAKRNVAQGYT